MTSEARAVAGGPPGQSQMTRDEIIALFDRRQKAHRDLDASALTGDYSEDCVVESPTAGTHRGRTAVQNVLQAWFDGFPDLKMHIDRLLIDDPHVVQVMRIEGTDLGGFLGLPPTDKRFQLSAVFIYELKGREIVREQRIYDFTGLLVQIGILKAKPA